MAVCGRNNLVLADLVAAPDVSGSRAEIAQVAAFGLCTGEAGVTGHCASSEPAASAPGRVLRASAAVFTPALVLSVPSPSASQPVARGARLMREATGNEELVRHGVLF